MYRPAQKDRHRTPWDRSGKWYHELVGESGHYYHQHVVIPGALRLLNLKPQDSLLDVGCGQGVLARAIPKGVAYLGVDASQSMITNARKEDRNSAHHYLVSDVTQSIPHSNHTYSHAALVLSLQNMNNPEAVFKNIAEKLANHGTLVIVLNHPCFRIPRQTSWGIDEAKKLQYRRIDRYFSPLKVPIDVHPGQQNHRVVWSYHYPLSDYSRFLKQSGFLIELLEEWTSDKQSSGSAAHMENFARKEFPLFLTIVARKQLLSETRELNPVPLGPKPSVLPMN